MSADYPASITTLFPDANSGQIIDIAFVNRMKEEIIAIETELGTDPAGGYSNIKTNLVIANRTAITDFKNDDLISMYDTAAGKNVKITTTNLVGQTVHVSHEEPSGTDGGTATSGSWIKIVINTLDDPKSFGFASISSSVLTLLAGRYLIEGSQKFYVVGKIRIRLRNTSDSTSDILGLTSFTHPSNGGSANSPLIGIVEIPSSKNYELQYKVEITKSVTGLGIASSLGEDEAFMRLKITKIG